MASYVFNLIFNFLNIYVYIPGLLINPGVNTFNYILIAIDPIKSYLFISFTPIKVVFIKDGINILYFCFDVFYLII